MVGVCLAKLWSGILLLGGVWVGIRLAELWSGIHLLGDMCVGAGLGSSDLSTLLGRVWPGQSALDPGLGWLDTFWSGIHLLGEMVLVLVSSSFGSFILPGSVCPT